MKTTLTKTFGNTLKAGARKEAGVLAGKAIAKTVSKVIGKTVARTAASPWLLATDAAELGATQLARVCGADKQTARRIGKGVGFGTALLVGGSLGGPPGAAAGAGVWLVGEGISQVFE